MIISLFAGQLKIKPIKQECFYTKPEIAKECGAILGEFNPDLHNMEHIHLGVEAEADGVVIRDKNADMLHKMFNGKSFKIKGEVRNGALIIEEEK